MSLLHLATPEDAQRLLPMVARFHEIMGFDTDAAHQEAAIQPLLEGAPQGAVWLIGPRKAPVGYIAVSFGWSVEFGGLDAIIDEIFVRQTVRGRGMGSEALSALTRALADNGVKALHLEAHKSNDALVRFYRRMHFQPREGFALMSRRLG